MKCLDYDANCPIDCPFNPERTSPWDDFDMPLYGTEDCEKWGSYNLLNVRE